MDDAGNSVGQVDVDIGGPGTQTEGSGFARFDELESQRYTATLALPPVLAEVYDPPESNTRSVWLAQGEVGYLAFKLIRKARLTVKVAKKNELGTTFVGATVTVTGREDAGNRPTQGGGIADFEMRSAGDYTINVQLGGEDAESFFTRETPATLVAGVDQEVLVEAEDINVVTTEIAPAEQDLWFHPEEDADHVVELTLKVTQTQPQVGYSGNLTVTCQDELVVYDDEGCTHPAEQLSLAADAGTAERPLWVKKGTAANGRVTITVTDASGPRIRVMEPATAAISLQAKNIVTPNITTASQEVWFRPMPDADEAVELTLTVTQTRPGVGYTGKVTVTCSDTLVVYTNDACTELANELMLSPDDAEVEIPLWAKKSEVARGTVTVTLADDPHESAVLLEPATAELVIEEINVITPVLTGDELVLVHNNDAQRPTTLSAFTLDVAESHPEHTCGDLEITINYGAEIDCFEDALCAIACASGTAIARARLPLPLFVKGAAEGDCAVSARAGSASDATDPSWVFGPDADLDVRVEDLELDAYTFRDGQSIVDLNHLVTRVGVPDLRELHAQNNTNDFTHGRLVLRQPSDRFWQKATQITLAALGGVQIYSDQAATIVKADVQQVDFAGPELELWVKTNAAVAMDVEPGGAVAWGGWAALLPTKVMTRCHVSCGATIAGSVKQLVYGDIMALDTFGFDKHLDRATRNECGNRVTGVGAPVLGTDMALSCAGAHHFYDHLSGFKVNKNFPNAGGALFTAFLNSMNLPPHAGGNNVTWSQQGRAFVVTHLQNNHAIVLHAATRALIEAHILNILVTRGHMNNYGFNVNHGVPGVHAEVLAADELLTAGVPAAEITVATYKVAAGNARGKRFVACSNCTGILMAAVRVITG